MTETTAVVAMAPGGKPQWVDDATGALSVGEPVQGCSIVIVGEDDAPLPVGEVSEVIINAGTNTPGYWRQPGRRKARRIPPACAAATWASWMRTSGCIWSIGRRT